MSRKYSTRPVAGYLSHSTRNHLITNDEFPLLDFKELSQCLQDCDFYASEELVSRPSSSFIHQLFEQILDTFVGLSPEYRMITAKSLLRQSNPVPNIQGQSDDQDEYDDTLDPLGLLVFFRAINMFLQKCGIHDFTHMDLMRPDILRTQRVLSGVINFARFREEHLHECEGLAREGEEALQEIRNVENQIVETQNRTHKLSERLREDSLSATTKATSDSAERSSISLLNKYNSKLEQELIKLQKSQEIFKREHASYKETKARLIEKLEDQHFLLSESERELKKMENYASTDPSLVKQVVTDLKLHLQTAEGELKDLELSARNKNRTHLSIQVVEDELRNLIKIVQEVSNELKMLENARETSFLQNEELNSKHQSSEELAVHLERARRQLKKSEEKIVKLRQQAAEKERTEIERFIALEKEYDILSKDRDAKRESLDKRKKENKEIEAELRKMELEFQVEFRNSEAAIAKLNAHIRQYMQELSQHL